jgi:hypothetical protein
VVDYYEENVASHRWPEDVGVEMTLLDAEGWRRAMERVGLLVAVQERVTQPAAAGLADWKVQEGSLLTLAHRPSE